MKTFLLLWFSMATFFFPNEEAVLGLCKIEVSSVSVSGSIGLSSDGGLDLSDACVTFHGSATICDDDGNELAELSFTAQSDGCDEDPLISPNDDPAHTLQSIEDIYNLSALNGGQVLEKSIPLAYPNPSNGNFTITNLESGFLISLIDSETGEILRTIKTKEEGEDVNIETKDLKPGTYFLKTISKDGKTNVTQTIIIN